MEVGIEGGAEAVEKGDGAELGVGGLRDCCVAGCVFR